MIVLKRYKYVIIFSFVSIITVAFIFGNSIKSSEASNEISGSIAEELYALFDEVDYDLFHKIVRKTAHFLEFSVLGVFLSLTMMSFYQISGATHVSVVLFISLFVAVADEFIQSFTDRTSAVADVLIDFSGSLFGFGLVLAFSFILRHKTSRKKVSSIE